MCRCVPRVKCKSFVLITLCDSEDILSLDKVITNMNAMERGTKCMKKGKPRSDSVCRCIEWGFESFTGYINFSSTSKRQHVTPEAYLKSLQSGLETLYAQISSYSTTLHCI